MKTRALLICGLLFFFSCNWFRENPENTFREVESLMENDPDSALYLLEVMLPPETFSPRHYNEYMLLKVKIKNKLKEDISKDTLMAGVCDYFLKSGDMDKAAQASFYWGRVLKAGDKYELATTAYKDAGVYIENLPNDNLKGLIQFDLGLLLFLQASRDEALARFKSAAGYFNKAGKYKNEIIAHNHIGRAFHLRGEVDSALFYYDKAYELTILHKDIEEQAWVTMNKGLLFHDVGQKETGRAYLRSVLCHPENRELMVKAYTNIARTFDSKAEKDSILFYTDNARDLLKDEQSPELMARVLHLLSIVEENNENYQKALDYHKQRVENLNAYYSKANEQAVLKANARYDFERIRNQNNQLTIEKQWSYMLVLFLAIVLLSISLVFYHKNTQNKQKMLEGQQQILRLRKLANTYDAEKMSMRNVLLKHFDILKKAALLEGYLNEDEKKQGEKLLKRFNDIVYNQDSLDWDMLFRTMNHLSDNFPDKLMEAYPELDPVEIKICCLTEADLSNMEIAIIMGLSVNTIQAKKSNIRRKLGVEGYKNIIEYLKKNM